MWLNVGIPALVLLGLIAARLVYYVYWRRHWDRRPERHQAFEQTEVVILDDTWLPAATESPPAVPRTNDART